eukprot:TRINITY_DN1354_c0_g2_i1.p1 TRINITY_DN1354_c0_g2~~TRINITY_DN1354_c0_g2_i1.p1  ORF type:complete len:145 (+),score=35.95 TRINITY_DN1354_c0_g2_i1:46-480(+)
MATSYISYPKPKGWIVQGSILRNGYIQGHVVAKNSEKTIRVAVRRRLQHKKYGASTSRTTVLMVHDEFNEAALGDKVIIRQSRKISKKKSFILHDIAVPYKPSAYLKANPEVAEQLVKVHQSDPEDNDVLRKYMLHTKVNNKIY